MLNLQFGDFVPPIVSKVIKHFQPKDVKDAAPNQMRVHPFDTVPSALCANWILDVGANRGDVTLAALASFPDAHVICFEPVRSTFELLSERLRPFQSRVHLYNCALSDVEGEGQINLTTFHGANSIFPQTDRHQRITHVREIGKEKIKLARLDSMASEFPNRTVDIVKIDVEGCEVNVLKGGHHFLSENVDIIMIEIALMRDRSWEEQVVFEIFSLLNTAGFRLINVYDLCPTDAGDLLLAQMDCVFRHRRNLTLA